MIHFNYPYYPMQWYSNKNPVSGNAGQFNYKVLRQGDELAAWCWMGLWCMEKTKDVKQQRFPFSEEGVQQAQDWLRQEFESHDRDEIEASGGFFNTEPYTPPPPEQAEETSAQ